jgi:hypothetical protein
MNRLIHVNEYEQALTNALGHDTFVQIDTKGNNRLIQSALLINRKAIPLYAHPILNHGNQQLDPEQFVAELPTHYRIGTLDERQSRLETLRQIHLLEEFALKSLREVFETNKTLAQNWHSIVLPSHLQTEEMQKRYQTSYRIGTLRTETFKALQQFITS